MSTGAERPNVLFVNSGILGLISFHHFLGAWLPRQNAIDGERLLLSAQVTTGERVVRRLLCQRLWRDGLLGIRNLDLARFRCEMHAGLLARRRRTLAGYDVLHFHRQATAYGSLDVMRRVPSILSIDCTQECVMQTARTSIERATYVPNVRMDGLAFRRARAIVATSRWAADSVRRWYPDCETPIHVMPNPVLLEHFDPSLADVRRGRAKAGRRVRALFVGGDFERKGGNVLLDAWAAARLAGRAELWIVTSTPPRRSLPPGVTVKTGVASHSPEWRTVWAEADLFVLPTRNEAFGLAFQEAGAAGLPAIGTRHNAVPEIVLDGETGLLVPVDDTDALVTALSRLIDDAGLRDRLGRNARRHVEATASPDRYMSALTALILEAWRGRS